MLYGPRNLVRITFAFRFQGHLRALLFEYEGHQVRVSRTPADCGIAAQQLDSNPQHEPELVHKNLKVVAHKVRRSHRRVRLHKLVDRWLAQQPLVGLPSEGLERFSQAQSEKSRAGIPLGYRADYITRRRRLRKMCSHFRRVPFQFNMAEYIVENLITFEKKILTAYNPSSASRAHTDSHVTTSQWSINTVMTVSVYINSTYISHIKQENVLINRIFKLLIYLKYE